MLTIMLRGPQIEKDAGFLDYTLIVTISLTTRNDLWQPVNIYAVNTSSLKFHVEQVKKWAVRSKLRVIVCKLDIAYDDKRLDGLFVPTDQVWPFSDFSRIDYQTIYDAAASTCRASQTTEASVITLWRKP